MYFSLHGYRRQSRYLLVNYENIAYERAAAQYTIIAYIFGDNFLTSFYEHTLI
jgi:hypothetical protein